MCSDIHSDYVYDDLVKKYYCMKCKKYFTKKEYKRKCNLPYIIGV